MNSPPVADAGPDRNVYRNAVTTLNGSESYDPDGDTLVYAWIQTSGPPVGMAGADTALPVITPGSAGIYRFRLYVMDGWGGIDNDAVNVTVANRNPIADAGPDQNVAMKTTVLLDGSASSDPDGDTLSFNWTQLDGPTVTLSRADVPTPIITPTTSGTYTFRLVVSDGDGGTATDIVSVVVESPPPNPPASDALPVNPWWLIVIIVGLLVIAILLFLDRRKWKARSAEIQAKEKETVSLPQRPIPPPPPANPPS